MVWDWKWVSNCRLWVVKPISSYFVWVHGKSFSVLKINCRPPAKNVSLFKRVPLFEKVNFCFVNLFFHPYSCFACFSSPAFLFLEPSPFPVSLWTTLSLCPHFLDPCCFLWPAFFLIPFFLWVLISSAHAYLGQRFPTFLVWWPTTPKFGISDPQLHDDPPRAGPRFFGTLAPNLF